MTDKAQIFLISRPIDDAEGAIDTLMQACGEGNVAAVLLSFTSEDERTQIKALKTIAPALQKTGAAVIVAGSPSVASRGGADGVHVASPGEPVQDAIDALKPERIVGVGGLRTRHEAMTIGEMDVDYLLFGEPRADGSLPELESTLERVSWWAEIFAVPCIGFAHSLADISEIAATGAEFVGLGEAVWAHPAGAAAAIAEAQAIIAATPVGDER